MAEYFGLDEEREKQETEEKVEKEIGKQRKDPFAYWNVGGQEYKLKLKTATICQLESKYKGNLLNVVLDGGIPPLAIMLTVIQGAMKEWQHGVKFEQVQRMFDQYCEEGGTQMTLFTDVILPILRVSGFFTEAQAEEMQRKTEEAKEMM